MLHCDLKRMAFDRIGVKETEKCPVCGESPTSDPGPLKEELAEELCGRGGRRVFIITPGLDQEPDLSLIGDNLGVGGKLIARGRLGLTFDDVSGRRVSVLSSGVAVIEGPRDRAEAVDIWQRVLALGGVFPSGRPQIASVLP